MKTYFSNTWKEKHSIHEPLFSAGLDITKGYFDFGVSVKYIDLIMVYVNTQTKYFYFSLIGFEFRVYFGW